MSEKDWMNFHIRTTLSSSPKLGNSMNTSNESIQNLKPCPFCGGKADFDYDDSGYNWVFCTKCGVTTDTDMHYEFDARLRLAKAWNTRADGWISVDDKLPEIYDLYDFAGNDVKASDIVMTNIEPAAYKDGEWVSAHWDCTECNKTVIGVTHWMPLPQPKSDAQ